MRIGPDVTHNGGRDAFVAKVNVAGTALDYCGFIGGSGDDAGFGDSVDTAGHAYVTGSTSSTEAILSRRPLAQMYVTAEEIGTHLSPW